MRLARTPCEFSQHRGEFVTYAFPPRAQDEAHENRTQALESVVPNDQLGPARHLLEIEGHEGIDGTASPAERKRARLFDRANLAVDDAVETGRRIGVELETDGQVGAGNRWA